LVVFIKKKIFLNIVGGFYKNKIEYLLKSKITWYFDWCFKKWIDLWYMEEIFCLLIWIVMVWLI